jgi:multimeric flavodoxin WrbA
MKVLLVNAGPHKQGNTFIALSAVSEQLKKNGIEAEIMQVGTHYVRSCIACAQCKAQGLGHCVFDDDICNRVIEQMAGSDAFIIGSPVYYGQPTGAALSLIHRMFYSAGDLFRNKPAAAVAVCRRGGATAAYQTMNMAFEMMSMPIVTSQYWNIVYGREPGQAALDTEGMQTMRTLADNMAFLLKRIHADGQPQYPQREPWTPMHFIR